MAHFVNPLTSFPFSFIIFRSSTLLVTLGMKTLSVVGEVSWWYNEEGFYTLLFSI
jgi:hypothetical protein